MYDDYEVHDMQVMDVPTLNRTGGSALNRQVTFWVGPHGPFIKLYTPAEYTPERVTTDQQAEVETLRAIGATSASSNGGR